MWTASMRRWSLLEMTGRRGLGKGTLDLGVEDCACELLL